jgi:hypothetical protein
MRPPRCRWVVFEKRQIQIDEADASKEDMIMSSDPASIDSGSFRKRPVIVKAFRYKGRSPKTIQTLEGPMTAMPGDWIITGVQGEKYSCKDDVFRQTYEPVGKTKATRQAFRRLG